MSKKIIDNIIKDPNSTLNEGDRAWLTGLAPEALKRLALGLQAPVQEVSVSNEDTIAGLKEDLATCQNDLVNVITAENELRKELEGFGIQTSSVLKQFIPVHNQAPPVKGGKALPTKLDEASAEEMLNLIIASGTRVGQCTQEAVNVWKQDRQRSIETIVTNSQGAFQPEELQMKRTAELQKLAAFVEQKTKQVSVYNYDGQGMADHTTGGLMGVRQLGGSDTLALPSTFQ